MSPGQDDDRDGVELRVGALEELVAAQAKAIDAIEASRSAMLELGVSIGQGYLLGRPGPL